MATESRKCEKCKEIVYGSREREADGYRTWWEIHNCITKKDTMKILGGVRYDKF